MKKNLVIIICLLSFIHGVMAQKGTISGSLNDKLKNPIEFANVALFNSKDTSLAKAAISDENGKFNFENVEQGNYLLMLTEVGFEKYWESIVYSNKEIELPTITMKESAINLKQAEVVAMRPLIEHHVDKTVVNVENTIISSGSTVIEVLKRSPGVTVDQDGNISLKGKQGVQVMIDGKPTYLSATDLNTMLKNMQSDQLSQIEIITNPSAKYDAAGNSGIINLKLRKKQNLGFNGSVSSSYGQGIYPDYSAGLNLNYRNEKMNVFGSYDYGKSFYYEKSTLVRRFKESDYTSTFDQKAIDKTRSDNRNAKAGIDFFINKKHTLGLLFKTNLSDNYDRTSSTTEIQNLSSLPDSGYTTINQSKGHWNNYSINLNHQFTIDTLGKELTTDIDYAKYNSSNDFNFETNYFSPLPNYQTYIEKEKNFQPATITIQSAKIDYTQPLSKKVKLETGLKSSYVTTDNDVKYYNTIEEVDIPDSSKTNHFNYKENINAAYVTLQTEAGKWGLQAGLRAEQTIAKGEQLTTSQNFKRDYLQLFPSAFVTYKIDDKNQLGLNYSRRIDRPAYQQLNPFRYFLDPKTFQEGNPDLQPQLTHSFEVSHTFIDAITTVINYSHTIDAMTQITKQIDSTRTTFVTTENFKTQDSYGLSLTVPYQITKWWLTSNNFNLFNNRFVGEIQGSDFDKQLTSYTINSYNSFTLPHGISFEISGYYNSRMVWATFLIDPQYSFSAGFAKSFFKDRLDLKININDIFKSERTLARVDYNNVNFDFRQGYDSRFIRFHFTYKFGKSTVEAARRRRGGSEDEQNRVNTGN